MLGLPPEVLTLTYRAPLILCYQLVEEDQEPPTKKARVSEGEYKLVRVENVAALIELERLD